MSRFYMPNIQNEHKSYKDMWVSNAKRLYFLLYYEIPNLIGLIPL